MAVYDRSGKLLAAQYIAAGITSGSVGDIAWGAEAERLAAESNQLQNTLQSGISNLANVTSLGVVNELSSPVLDVVAPLTFAAPVHRAALTSGAPSVTGQFFPSQAIEPARQAWETFSRVSETFSGMSGPAYLPQQGIFGRAYQASLAAAIRAATSRASRAGYLTGISRVSGRLSRLRQAARTSIFRRRAIAGGVIS